MDSERATVAPASGTTPITTLTIWLNAFIPGNLEGVKVVPGHGAHAGKTMLPSPGPVDAWFLTDQRGFSADPNAHSRMHSEIEIDMAARRVAGQRHRCDETVQVDSETGEQLCRDLPDNSDMAFEAFHTEPETGVMKVKLRGATKNACLKVANIKVSPNLDYVGELSIAVDDERTKVAITFNGRVEVYPAFEMYASINHGPPAAIFRAAVEPGATPLNLAGPAARPITVTVRLPDGA